MDGERRKRVSSVLLAVGIWCSIASVLVAAERNLVLHDRKTEMSEETETADLHRFIAFLWLPKESSYVHVWPAMKFGWKIVLGTIIGALGAALGSVGGVGGGGIFIPMLTLIIGFDAKSSTAISKCMIMGGAASTVYYNLKLRHPTLPLPIIDYDLALLFQPMLMLGISIGVVFNVVFADWMLTVSLIILFLGTSTKAFFKGVETWKKETIAKRAAGASKEDGSVEVEYGPLPSGPSNSVKSESEDSTQNDEVSIMENVYWKELFLLVFVWIAFLGLQIAKNYTSTCSIVYWVLNLLQIPISFGVTLFEAVSLYKGRRTIASRGEEGTNLKIHRLIAYCCFGILAGIVAGLLGIGGGFVLGPLFLELGIPPEVSSATATFAMTFSSSMSVVEYYLLKRFPVPYAMYFVAVAAAAALMGQHLVRKLIIILGRASLIIFILASVLFIGAISLGGVSISNMIKKIENHEYMGFESLCSYSG